MMPPIHRPVTSIVLGKPFSDKLSMALMTIPPNINHTTPTIKAFHLSTKVIIP